jgi:hypothetical protein
MGSVDMALKKPHKSLFFNSNLRILLQVTKRVHGEIFIDSDRTHYLVIAVDVKSLKLQFS